MSVAGLRGLMITVTSLFGQISDSGTNSDTLCGARCIHYVLRNFGVVQPDLPQLVERLNWPQLNDPVTFDKLKAVLDEQEIYTLPLKIEPTVLIEWRHPVIVHMNGAALGHFVVLIPTADSNDTVDLYDGLAGTVRVPQSEFQRERSGIVLLTSPQPIDLALIQFKKRRSLPLWTISAFVVICMGTGMFVSIVRFRKRRP